KDGTRALVREVLVASRPFSWVNTAYPFAAGYLLATDGRVDATFVVGTLFFLVPYNLLMYGINDVFDYASDLANPRKGGIEGGLVDPARAAAVHRRILWSCAAAVLPFVAYLLAVGSAAAGATLALVLFLVVAYSAPVLRFKERPVLDSLTSAMHFVGPLLYALVLVGADLTARTTWPALVAFVLWGMASHAFGAVQDVRADREGGIASVATVLGAHPTVVGATLAYVASAAVLLVLPWPGVLAAGLPLLYAASTARFWSVRDDDCERANHGWRTFLWLNLVAGALVTMLLLAAAVERPGTDVAGAGTDAPTTGPVSTA
ncbi:prenyltransferase, partial [Cellulomonas marina]